MILNCSGLTHIFTDAKDREDTWKAMRGEDGYCQKTCASKLLKIREEIIEDNNERKLKKIAFQQKDCVTQ